MLSFDGKGISSCLFVGKTPLGSGMFSMSADGRGMSPASGNGISVLEGSGISAVDRVILLFPPLIGMMIGVRDVVRPACSEI